MTTIPVGRAFTSAVRPRSLVLLAGLVALGMAQVASLAYFLRESRDFLRAKAETNTTAGEIAIPGEVFLRDCLPCLRSGWGGPYPYGVMAQQGNAVLALKLPASARTDGGDLVLVLDAAVYAPSEMAVNRRVLTLQANGTQIGEVEFPRGDPRDERFGRGEPVLHRFIVPHSVVAQGPILLLTLQTAPMVTPRELGINPFAAPLGVAVRSLHLSFDVDAGVPATARQ